MCVCVLVYLTISALSALTEFNPLWKVQQCPHNSRSPHCYNPSVPLPSTHEDWKTQLTVLIQEIVMNLPQNEAYIYNGFIFQKTQVHMNILLENGK